MIERKTITLLDVNNNFNHFLSIKLLANTVSQTISAYLSFASVKLGAKLAFLYFLWFAFKLKL